MNNLERLIAIEAIPELKARHCRLADYPGTTVLFACRRTGTLPQKRHCHAGTSSAERNLGPPSQGKSISSATLGPSAFWSS
jgi:hypothetical protein